MKIDDYVRDKNVIIVGPSAYAKEDCHGTDVDSYDVIVRINHHYKKIREEDRKVVGHRTDVIYHNADPSLITQQDINYWRKYKVKIVTIYCWKTRPIDQYGLDSFYYIDEDDSFFRKLEREMKTIPNSGNVAMLHLLSLQTKILSVVGFDFYRTLYLNDDDEKARQKFLMGHKSRQTGNLFTDNNVYNDDNREKKDAMDPKLQLEYIRKRCMTDDRFIPIGKLKELLETNSVEQ